MTARKPLVPEELRELLTLMRDLSESLPIPATSADGAWDARRKRGNRRASVLCTRLHTLAVELEMADKYPSVAAAGLTRYCERTSADIREELARPLGYEPWTEKETDTEKEAGQ